MEMSGNLYERPVTVGNPTGRLFTGTHGDGLLTLAGNADVSGWPGTNGVGAGFRGGDWYNGETSLQVSGRNNAAYTYVNRYYIFGGRGVRSAP
jgi:hypothetical protein